MRRHLLAWVVTGLTLVAITAFAVAEGPSAVTSAANQSSGSYAQPQDDLRNIQGNKTVTIVANGILPRALAVDPRANVYLTNAAAPNRIFTLTGLADLAAHGAAGADASTRLALVAGNGAAGSLGDGASALAAQFNMKMSSLAMRSGIAVGEDGTIFVADTRNSTIRRIAGSDSTEPGITRSIAGRWAAPQNSQIVEPLGVALDRAGNLYVADYASGAIDLLPAATESSPGEQRVQVLAHVAAPAGIALTADGSQAFVASPDTGAVVAIDTQTRGIRSVAAFPAQSSASTDGSKPACEAAGSEGSESGAICPAGIAVDGAGNLFVADANSGKILRVDAKTSALTTAASGLRSPGDMSFDSNGNLYVAEQGANRIIKFASMGADPSNLTLTPPAALPPPPPPRVCPQTAPFNFCDQPVGGTTATQGFTLTNNTSAAVTGLAISFTGSNPGDFQAPSNTCGTSLAAGASCNVNANFAPTTSGSRSASLSVTDSAGDSAAANVSGTGDDYQIVLSGSPQEQSVIQGGTITYNFNVVPDAVFGGVVNIVCPSNLPSLTTCAPSQDSVTVTPGTPASFSMTFQTTYDNVTGGVPSNGLLPGVMIRRDPDEPGAPATPLATLEILLAGLAFLVFSGIWLKRLAGVRPASANVIWGRSFLLVSCGFVLLAGCKHSSVPANLNTPVGSTSMTVQGTAQNSGRGVTIILDVVGRG